MPFDSIEVSNGKQVKSMIQMLRHGGAMLDTLPGLLVTYLSDAPEKHIWRGFICEVTGEFVQFDSFEEFVTAKLPKGLGTTVQRLKHLCRDEPQALDAIDRACRGQHGGDRRSEEARIKCDNVTLDPIQPTGNSREYALAKLRRDRPDLHARVLAGELSAHAAMIEAGFRKRATPIDRLRSAWRAATPAERAAFIAEATR